MKLQTLLAAAVIAVASIPQDVPAQGTGQSSTAAQIPPALRAAIQAGNPSSIQQVIATLAAGNPGRAAELAALTARAAQDLVATNPAAALAAASAAVAVFKQAPVMAANPSAAQEVLATAARIALRPEIQRLNPDQANALSASIRGVIQSSPSFASSSAGVQIISSLNSSTGSNQQTSSPFSSGSGSTASSGSGSGSGAGGGGSAR